MADLSGFSVYATKRGPTGWYKIKLAANGKRENKANFLLAWNGRRFAVNRDLEVMQEHLPELFDQILILAQEEL